MTDKIQEILNDLYAYDKSFMQHEEELKKIISHLLKAKPDTKFDTLFAQKLRQELIFKTTHMESKTTFWQNFTASKFSFALSGALAIAVVILGAQYSKQQNQITKVASQELFSGKVAIENLSKNAFGKLDLQNLSTPERNQSGGGGSTSMNTVSSVPVQDASDPLPPTASKAMGMGGGGGGTSMIYPSYQVKYVYKGEKFTIENPEAEVYKKIKSPLNANAFKDALNSLNFGALNLKSFSNLAVQNLSFAEDKDFGYAFNINFQEGMFSISENWEKWQTSDRTCTEPDCYEKYRLKPSDIPADNELIAIADSFLDTHGINKENYGAPVVQNYWRTELLRASDPSQIWIPDVSNVVYPLKVNGQEVYDQYGNKTGLTVSVNVRVKKVSGLYDLNEQKFQASTYAAETDADKLIKLAEQGGFNYGYPMPLMEEANNNVITQEVSLGSPTLALVKYYSYKDGKNEELLIPSLVFPVTSQIKEPFYYYNQSVVIPLVSEVISGFDGPVKIMR